MKRVIQKSKNEDGYVLIVVILLVVLIMGFSSVFMTNAISHTKQEETVDQQHLIVAAAEMGVEYYSSMLLNSYERNIKKFQTAGDSILDELESSLKKGLNSEVNISLINMEIQNAVANEIIKSLNEEIEELSMVKSIIGDYQYYIKNENPLIIEDTRENGNILVLGNVYGKNIETNIEQKINFLQQFLIPDFSEVVSEFVKEAHDNDNDKVARLPEIEESLNSIDLSYLKEIEDKCQLNSGHVGNNKCWEEKDINLNGNHFDNHSRIYMMKDYNLNYNLAIGNESILEVIGDTIVNQLSMYKNSKIKIGSNLIVKNNDITMSQSTQLLVANNLDILKGALNVYSTIELMVGGNLNVKKNIHFTNESKVRVGGDLELHEGRLTLDSNANLITGDTIKMNNNITLNKATKLGAGGNIELKNSNIVLNNSSTLIAGGNLNLDNGSLNMNGSTTVCVHGNFEVRNNFKFNGLWNDSRIYVGGQTIGFDENDSAFTSGRIVQGELPDRCNLPMVSESVDDKDDDSNDSSLDNLEWKKPIIEVSYD